MRPSTNSRSTSGARITSPTKSPSNWRSSPASSQSGKLSTVGYPKTWPTRTRACASTSNVSTTVFCRISNSKPNAWWTPVPWHNTQSKRSMTMTTTNTDLLGKPLTEQEQELLNVYDALKKLAAQDDLPPYVARNVRQALASMWQATNDLDLQFEQLYDLGVED